jgi:diguanylate cyclase (GGDEF)-like protein
VSDLPPSDDFALSPLLDQLSDGIAVAAPQPWRLLDVNSTLADWFGKRKDELQGAAVEKLFDPASRAQVLKLADSVCHGSAATAAMTAHLRTDDLEFGAVDVRFCRILAGNEVRLGIVVRRGALRPQAAPTTAERRDPLTGLPDREFLLRRLAALLHGARSGDRQFAVLFVDLDNFKQVNDAHGHLMGDRVLREVARRLSGCVRDGDYVVRFGGDEFVVLVDGVRGANEIEPIVRRIHTTLEKPIALPEGEFTPSLSIGVAEASPDHHSPEDLLRDADRAMYAAKRVRNATGASNSA